MDREHKKIIRIIIGVLLFIAAIIIKSTLVDADSLSLTDIDSLAEAAVIALYFLAYITTGIDVLWKAVKNLFKGHVFDENFLMTIATIGAFAIGEFPEGVAVMWLYQVGEFFQDYAVDKSRDSITDLMDIRPDTACVKREGRLMTVNPDEVEIGEIILVKAGEKVPLDGVVVSGRSQLNTAALTGESVPTEVFEGQDIISGCVNISGTLEIKTTRSFKESTVSKILDLVENASNKKGKSEKFISRFAKYYTPCVVMAAVAIAIIPALVIPGAEFSDWIYKALVFLMVSCPCALVISIPLGFFAGIGAASRNGILVKGGNYLEQLSMLDTVVFDKTGTLTKGDFIVTGINNYDATKSELLKLAASAEQYSIHPIGLAVVKAYKQDLQDKLYEISDINEEAGFGVSANVNGKRVLAGNRKLMEKNRIACEEPKASGTVIHVACDGRYIGNLIIEDEIKADAQAAINELKKNGIKKAVMLTGDRQETAEAVAKKTGIDEYHARLLPANKVEIVEKLLESEQDGKLLAFVGDGINDAPVLARADVGIAMGGLGSDAAIEAADVVIMTDEPSKLNTAIRISRKTRRLVMQNIVFALSVKGLVLILSILGLTNMWAAVIVDVGVSLLAVLNSIRALK